MATLTPVIAPLSKRSGSVLILSLWVLTFMVMICARLAYSARLEMRLGQYQWDQIRLLQIAKQVVFKNAVYWQKNTPGYAALNQSWNGNPEEFRDHLFDGGTYTLGHDTNQYGLEDESRKINVNIASRPVLERVFGINRTVVPAILEWRAPGPDQGNYGSAGYRCRHGYLKSMDELLLIRGMTPEIYDDVRDVLTVYGSGTVNINTASERVLLALGLPSSAVHKILFFRAGRDEQIGTADDGDFTSLGTVIPSVSKVARLSDSENRSLSTLLQKRVLDVQSDTVQFHLSVRLSDTGSTARYTIVAAARSIPPRILAWGETAR